MKNTYTKKIVIVLVLASVLMTILGCSSNSQKSPEYAVNKTNEISVLKGLFSIGIPEGIESKGFEKDSDFQSEIFRPVEKNSTAVISITSNTIKELIDADDFAANYFLKPPKDADYTYKNIKVSTLSNGHIISFADRYEKNAKTSREMNICFACDGNRMVHISIEGFDSWYRNKVVSTIHMN